MLTVKLETKVFDRRVQRTERALSDIMRSGVFAAAKHGAAHARRFHLHKKRTGKLTSRANLFARMLKYGFTRSEAEIVNTTEYARYVEYPTRAHTIRPKPRPATNGRSGVWLRFQIGRKVYFARAVRHPGTPGFPFMRPALDRAETYLRKYIQTVGRNRLRRIWQHG